MFFITFGIILFVQVAGFLYFCFQVAQAQIIANELTSTTEIPVLVQSIIAFDTQAPVRVIARNDENTSGRGTIVLDIGRIAQYGAYEDIRRVEVSMEPFIASFPWWCVFAYIHFSGIPRYVHLCNRPLVRVRNPLSYLISNPQ